MKPAGGRKTSEIVKCWRSPCLPDVDLLHARYTAQSFSRHAHDGYAVGVIEQGALSFSYRGGTWIAPAGQINLAVPGEAHTGTGVNGLGWTYRMFYLPPERLHQVTTEITGRPGYFPFFAAGVINDLQLAGQIQKLHKALEENETSRLEQEEGLLALLTSLVLHYAEPRQGLRDPSREPSAVKHALEYLEAHYAENLSIQDLAGLCHLSPYYFIRSFTAQVGVSPHLMPINNRSGCVRPGSCWNRAAQQPLSPRKAASSTRAIFQGGFVKSPACHRDNTAILYNPPADCGTIMKPVESDGVSRRQNGSRG